LLSDEILRRCIDICPELQIDGQPFKIIGSKVGLRPTRHGGIRLESEFVGDKLQVLLIHNYGHGGMLSIRLISGYGYQSSWGTANSVLKICEERRSFKGVVKASL
jgi:D-amino-acid oxidase